MKARKLIYISISVICAACIIIGIFTQVKKSFKPRNVINTENIIQTEEKTNTLKTAEDIKKEFNDIFDNKFHIDNYDSSSINKIDSTKEIVYTFFELQETKENYDINIALPMINIADNVASDFNTNTQNVFANKANEIFENAKENTVYTIEYTGYINGDIMSVIIKSTLKEASNAQRTIVQTYNYNLKTGKEATIEDAIDQRGTTQDDVSKKINNQINQAIKEANDIQVSGYEVFARDINDERYKVENTDTFYMGEDGTLYIIYAYGNNEFTSEMDIIVI